MRSRHTLRPFLVAAGATILFAGSIACGDDDADSATAGSGGSGNASSTGGNGDGGTPGVGGSGAAGGADATGGTNATGGQGGDGGAGGEPPDPPTPAPEFSLPDVNPNNTLTVNYTVGQFNGQISAWFFGHST